MNKTFDDATNIQEQLIQSSLRLSVASEALEQIRLQKRAAIQEIELLKADLFSEQRALGNQGIFKDATNEKSRDAAFTSFFERANLPAVKEFKALELKELNAKIAEQTEANHFDALKKVADLQIRKLEYETQSVALQLILKRAQEAQK